MEDAMLTGTQKHMSAEGSIYMILLEPGSVIMNIYMITKAEEFL